LLLSEASVSGIFQEVNMLRDSCCFAVVLALLVFCGLTANAAQEITAAAKLPLASTVADQTSVAVTIYNSNLGLVKDQRTIRLPQGSGELRFMDVASKIIPASVAIQSRNDPASLSILEQNYEYDLLNPEKLLNKYVGKEVQLYQKTPYTDKEEVVAATLLANNDGPIFRIGDGVTFGHPGRVIFPGVPADLIAKPTLVWLLDNRLANPQQVEATYLTEGISWRADYVLTLNDKDTLADLAGWVTIDNQSGASYRNANLKLVAGGVNRVTEEVPLDKGFLRKKELLYDTRAPQFKEQSFFEYHIYTLQRPSTIKENQTKQISLLSADSVPVKKELLFKGAKNYYYDREEELQSNQKVIVYVEIENREKLHLGIPLPKGTVRVYKHDSDGALQFIGEDSIDHTPKDEKVRVKLGEAFDVVGSRKQTDWKKLGKHLYEAAFEVTLRNHKQEAVVVKVVEPIPGDWTMLSSSHTYTKDAAFTAEFQIPVAKDGETKLRYRVRLRF